MAEKINSTINQFFRKIFRDWLLVTVLLFGITSLISIKFPLCVKPYKGFEILVGSPLCFYASEAGVPWPGGFYRKMFLMEFYLVDVAFWMIVSFFMVWIVYGRSKCCRREHEKV